MKRKNSKLKKQQSHHGVILQQGSEQAQLQSTVKPRPIAEERDALDAEEQENLKKLKEKVKKNLN